MVLEFTVIWMELDTKDSGGRISNMDKELKHGQMEQAIRVTT